MLKIAENIAAIEASNLFARFPNLITPLFVCNNICLYNRANRRAEIRLSGIYGFYQPPESGAKVRPENQPIKSRLLPLESLNSKCRCGPVETPVLPT